MKNHLKWARLKVKGDERSVQKKLKIEDKCLIFVISFWSETLTMVIACEEKILLEYSQVLEMHNEALRLDNCFKE